MKDYVGTALLLNMRHHYFQDKMNAEANNSSVRFRPITVETAFACQQYFAVALPDEAEMVIQWSENNA